MPPSHFPTDPDENAASIVNLAAVLFGCLEAADAATVVEIGAFHGKSTAELLVWATGRKARVVAVDPTPEPALRDLARDHPELELIEKPSLEALAGLEADAVILDGDHNYFTLSEELRLIEQRNPGAALPLLFCHDIGWPLARRDSYYAPERIPPEHRKPLARDTFLLPGESATVAAGMPFACVAAEEGGAANGTLTAVEDFLEGREELRLAIVPAFFGLGVVWHREAPWAAAVAEAVEHWDRDPTLERLEANRIRQMTERYRITKLLDDLEARVEPQRELLRTMAGSRAFGLAERLARVRGGSEPGISRDAVRRALGDG